MAISVLKQGVDPKNEYSVCCPNCKSVLKYTYEDAVKNTQVATWHEFHINCPVCNHIFSHNSNPITKEKLSSTDTTIWVNGKGSSVIPSGCKAYGLYLNGSNLEAHEFDKIIPTGIPALIVGTCTEIEVLTGVSVEDPFNKLTKAPILKIEEDNRDSYYTVGKDFSIQKMSNKADLFGLPPQSSHLEGTKVVNFDLSK